MNGEYLRTAAARSRGQGSGHDQSGAARSRRERLEDLERDKEALLEYHARLVPEDLDGLTSEQRQTLYRMMRLKFWPATECLPLPSGVVMP